MAAGRKKRALLLIGAGASLDFGAPSTSSLTKAVEARIQTDDWMRHCGGEAAYVKIRDALLVFCP